MTTTQAFLARGLFPAELPPPFQTVLFAKAVIANLHAAPPAFLAHEPAPAATHNLARYGTLRRRLQVPNPICYFPLARTIGLNWPALINRITQSPFSLSIPHQGPPSGRAVISKPGWSDRLAKRVELRARGSFVLRADISRFYPSVYTHSISWAMHGKATARRNRRSRSLLGNQLDENSRRIQDGQSIGLPIGPDTSFVLAELLLQSIDQSLATAIPPRNGFRVSDDYEFTFATYGAAEQARASLQGHLEEFSLSLNEQKTVIFELPSRLEDEWTSHLRGHQFRSTSPAAQRSDIVDYFDAAFSLLQDHPNSHILRYAIARLRGVSIHSTNWRYTEQLLLQSLRIDSGTITYVLRELILAAKSGLPLGHSAIGDALSSVIVRHAPLGHGSEVAWAIWGFMALNIPIARDAAQAVSKSEDSFVALIALDAQSRGLIPAGLSVSLWQSLMTDGALFSEHWLLAYEADVKGWLPGIVAQDPAFGWLRDLGVEFYDPSNVVGAVPTTASPSAGLGPLFSFP